MSTVLKAGRAGLFTGFTAGAQGTVAYARSVLSGGGRHKPIAAMTSGGDPPVISIRVLARMSSDSRVRAASISG